MTVASEHADPQSLGARTLTVALVGNPNSGKTTLFNALTGMRQKVGNYPGVTVERKEGRASLPGGGSARVFDLPGLYSLTAHSPDELIAREVLLGARSGVPKPDVVVNVVDASNLERNLYVTSQIIDVGVPVVIALTMTDTLGRKEIALDVKRLSALLGVPVVAVVASKREGLSELLEVIAHADDHPAPEPAWTIPPGSEPFLDELTTAIAAECALDERAAHAEAVSLLMHDSDATPPAYLSGDLQGRVRQTREALAATGIDFAAGSVESRYAWAVGIASGVTRKTSGNAEAKVTGTQRVDRVVMHPFWGYVIFALVMTIVFQSIYSWVQTPMDWIKNGIDHLGEWLTHVMPAGDLLNLLKDGVLGGVGNTVAFLPQILLLFFFISLLEDTGYMARAAFLMDRLMSKVGLHGKSFIPLLSSFACAIPGIMATRTIGDRKARLITILVAPLMSCSARLPVYALMIGAFIPARAAVKIGGLTLLTLPGLTMVAMYFLGMIAAFCVAWIFHRTLLKGISPTFVMELPPYHRPNFKTVLVQMVERAGLFFRRAGTVILAVSVVLWALSTYPRRPDLPEAQRLEHSYVGYAGRALEPVIAPLGFDWKMGIGIVSSFIAREVFVSAMGTVYNVADTESDQGKVDLKQKLRDDRDPRTGKRVWSPLVAVCLMIYYVLAMQCMSTVAVVRRETNGWKWPIFQIAYMTGLAWFTTFAVFQFGHMMGWG
jgi:ferrous iron transport protein B